MMDLRNIGFDASLAPGTAALGVTAGATVLLKQVSASGVLALIEGHDYKVVVEGASLSREIPVAFDGDRVLFDINDLRWE
jgi:hypothetical protein